MRVLGPAALPCAWAVMAAAGDGAGAGAAALAASVRDFVAGQQDGCAAEVAAGTGRVRLRGVAGRGHGWGAAGRVVGMGWDGPGPAQARLCGRAWQGVGQNMAMGCGAWPCSCGLGMGRE